MNNGVFGSGYLGTVTCACLADFGVPVTCFDQDTTRINRILQGDVPFFEKDLAQLIRRNIRAGRLRYAAELESLTHKARIIFLAEDPYRNVEDIAVKIAAHCTEKQFLVIVTPVPVETASRIEGRIRAAEGKMAVVPHPLFLSAAPAGFGSQEFLL